MLDMASISPVHSSSSCPHPSPSRPLTLVSKIGSSVLNLDRAGNCGQMRAAGASGAATLEMKGNDDLMGKEGELTQSRTMHAEVSPPPRSHSRPSRMKHKAHVMPSVRLTQEAFWCGTAGRLPHCSNLLSVVILLLQVIILLLYFALHCTGKGRARRGRGETSYAGTMSIND